MIRKPKTVVLYLRVSTTGQTIENQRQALAAAAERRGWQIVDEFVDQGISGVKGRGERPSFNRLHKAIVRREFDIVAAWSVDRLGRSLQDLVAFLGESTGSGLTYTWSSKASTPPPRPARRCFRCSAYSRNSSAASFRSASAPG